MKEKEMVTIPEAAKLLDCTRQNVYQTIDRYKIPTSEVRVLKEQTVKRSVKVRKVDLNILKGLIKTGDLSELSE